MEWLRTTKDYLTDRFAAISKPASLSVLTCLATLLSALASLFSWRASLHANQVANASQAFAQRVHAEDVAMSAPSISVLSGETLVSGHRTSFDSSDSSTPHYAVNVVLRNSGLRDAKRVWVTVIPEGQNFGDPTPKLIALPKGVDVPVRFELDTDPNTDGNTDWYVGLIYEDEAPADTTNGSATASSAADTPLKTTCSGVHMFKLSSWSKDSTGDPKIRVLSSGSPVAVAPVTAGQNGFMSSDQAASNDLTSENFCQTR